MIVHLLVLYKPQLETQKKQNKERQENALNASCRLVNNYEVFPFGD